jgi:hypothetical protein
MFWIWKNDNSTTWPQLFWPVGAMLLALFAAPVAASDIDFFKNELNRQARSNLSHLSNSQRKVINLADRYRMQKEAQNRGKSPAATSLPPVVANNRTGDSDSDAEPYSGSSSSLGKSLITYSLTQDDCQQMLLNLGEKEHPKGLIHRAQEQLVVLGFNLAKVDDKLGDETKAALNQFCLNARFALSNVLLDMLQTHVVLFKVNPAWSKILASRDFISWALTQPDQEDIGKTRQLGTSKEVIKLLDRYMVRKSLVSPTDDLNVSYSLTKNDFGLLQSTIGISKLIEKLKGEQYSGKKEFDAGLEAAFKGVANSERYMQLIQKHADLQAGLVLTEASFRSLKAKNIPEFIINSIQGLKDINYSGSDINAAVGEAVTSLSDSLREYKPEEIVQLAKASSTGIKFTDESIKNFSETYKKEHPLYPVILDRLQKMQIVEYQNSKTMLSALKNVLKQIADEISNSEPVIISETEEITAYSLTEESIQEVNIQLKDFIVPEIYLELLASLQDVEFPDQELFWRAAKVELSLSGNYNKLRQSIYGVISKLRASNVDKVFLGQLREEKVPPAVIAHLATLQDRKFGDQKELEAEIGKIFVQLKEQFEAFRPLVVAQAKKKHSFDKTKKIQWSGESCNCVHDHLSGVVYGFYPYWSAGEKQAIDFSVLTRVGYYGLGFDDKGGIVEASRWQSQDTGFISEAQKYNTKVDLVISREDWSTWGELSLEEKIAIFENLAMNIGSLLDIPLADPISRITPYLTLGTSRAPKMGDGVTLYFKGYPQDKESVAAFKAFTRNLKEYFLMQKRKYSLNMMFSRAEMGNGIYDYPKLKEFMELAEGSNKNFDTLFLILLDEPTSNNKKQLRISIENEMHSSARVEMLRNVVIIRSVDKNNEKQLIDDVIYAKDTFGGVGFWPQPYGTEGNAGENIVSKAINSYYVSNLGVDTSFNRSVCHYVCPNRLAFRVAWQVIIFLLVACVFIYFAKCDYRVIIEARLIYIIIGVVAPACMLSLALLYCDPFLSKIFEGESLLIFIVLALIGYSIWSHQDKLKKANLP